MNIFVRILPITVGLIILYFNTRALIYKNITEGYAFWWGIFGLVSIICGIFPNIIYYVSNLTCLKPATLVLAGIITMMLFMIFRLIRQVTEVLKKQSELAMQITLLNQENEMYKKDTCHTDEPSPEKSIN